MAEPCANFDAKITEDCDGSTVKKLSDFPSKKQYKKYVKQLKWQMNLPKKRRDEKLKKKAKRATGVRTNGSLTRKQLKHLPRTADVSGGDDGGGGGESTRQTIVIDLSFDHLMSEKDVAKVVKQLARCYAENRRSSCPMQINICNLATAPAALDCLRKYSGYEKWDVRFHDADYLNVFGCDRDRLVYLTSDSDNIIEELDERCVYIIGGLVDHNSQKNVCLNKAIADNIKHGQLPLGKWLEMRRRKVLTINHVFEIMLKVGEGKSFLHAFEAVLPKRFNIAKKNGDS